MGEQIRCAVCDDRFYEDWRHAIAICEECMKRLPEDMREPVNAALRRGRRAERSLENERRQRKAAQDDLRRVVNAGGEVGPHALPRPKIAYAGTSGDHSVWNVIVDGEWVAAVHVGDGQAWAETSDGGSF